MKQDGRQILDQAYDGLERELPAPLARALRWLRGPKARPVRLIAGIAFLIGSLFWFLPVLGIEMAPIGLLLIAQDVPFLRRPVGLAILWGLERWRRLCRWWQRRRGTSGPAGSRR